MDHRRALVGVSALALLVGLVVPAAAVSSAGALPGGRVALSGTVSPAATRAPRVGAVAASSEVDFELALSLRDRSGAEALANASSTPGNASYRHYLTPGEWETRFSPTAAQVARATSWLRQQGFAVASVSDDRLLISASGTAAQVERAFGTTLSLHKVNGQAVRMADKDLSIPVDLAGIVTGAVGVNQTIATPAGITGAPVASAAVATGKKIPQPPGFRVATPCGSYYGQQVDKVQPPFGQGYPYPAPYAVCGYTPAQLRSAYNLPSQSPGGTNGSGVTVAVIDAYASPTLLADGQQYAHLNDASHPLASSQFSERLSPTFRNAALCNASGWFGEQTLDIEAVHATAPGAHILYVGAQSCVGSSLFDSVKKVVDKGLASVVTDSWGDNGGDLLDDAATRASFDNTLLMAAGTGVSVLFSSGDNGDEFSTLGVAVADYPPSSPWATAVGGTTLQVGSTGTRLGELGWSTGRSFLCTTNKVGNPGCTTATLGKWLPVTTDGGSGGGTSYIYAQPSYQVGVVPNALATRNSPIIGPNPARVEPDISMEADPGTGFLVGETQTFPDGVHYGQYRIGGTSVSSPLLAGVIALADQASGTPVGFLNPSLYKLDTTQPSVIYDVVSGGKQDQSRVDFANSLDASQGLFFSTRIIDYQGVETYCDGTGNCASRNDVISTLKGYDDMTGLGAPTTGFVSALAKM